MISQTWLVNCSSDLKHTKFKIKDPIKRMRIADKNFNECSFALQIFEEMSFVNCSFNSCNFKYTKFKNVEFHNCQFENCLFYKPTFKEVYINPKQFKYSHKWVIKYPNVLTGHYWALYRNSKDQHQDKFSRYADVKFRFYRRYEKLFKKGKFTLKYLPNFSTDLLYDIFLGYGYGLRNALTTTMIIFGILIYSLHKMWEIMGLPEKANLITKIYYLAVTYSTVGYGEIHPEMNNHDGMIFVICLAGFAVVWSAVITAMITKRIVK